MVVVCCVACELPTPVDTDAGVLPPDSGQAHETDAGVRDAGFPSECEGTCRETTLNARLGDDEAPLDRVQFGFTSPERSVRGRWEVYLEAHAGGDPACPVETSPTPDRTVVIGGVTIPADATPQTRDGGLSLVMLDFNGALTDEPLIRADTVTLTPSSAKLCPECVLDGGAPGDMFFAFELTAAFSDGGIQGHGFAEYCPSLDNL